MKPLEKKRAISVQLTPRTLADIDRLAKASNMSRNRYLTLLFYRKAGAQEGRARGRSADKGPAGGDFIK